MPSDADPDNPRAVVERFIVLVQAGEWDDAFALLAEDVAYTNVSLPTLRGRRRVSRVLRAALAHDAMEFEIHTHHCGVDGDVVLTERTDAMSVGRLRIQFWVYGRFEVRDGRIAVWRDSFDWLNVVLSALRGVVGVVISPVRAQPPLD